MAHLGASQPSVAPEGWDIALTSLPLRPTWASLNPGEGIFPPFGAADSIWVFSHPNPCCYGGGWEVLSCFAGTDTTKPHQTPARSWDFSLHCSNTRFPFVLAEFNFPCRVCLSHFLALSVMQKLLCWLHFLILELPSCPPPCLGGADGRLCKYLVFLLPWHQPLGFPSPLSLLFSAGVCLFLGLWGLTDTLLEVMGAIFLLHRGGE